MSASWVDELAKKHKAYIEQEEIKKLQEKKKAEDYAKRIEEEAVEIIDSFLPEIFKALSEKNPKDSHFNVCFDTHMCFYDTPNGAREMAPYLFDSFVRATEIINSVDHRIQGYHNYAEEYEYVNFVLSFE